MKIFLSFIFGVALGASVLIWGPQATPSAGDDAVAVASAGGDVQCPYLQGKMSRSAGSAHAECPYLSGRSDHSAMNGGSGCPYLSGQTDQPAGAGQGACPYLQGEKDKSGGACPFRDGKAGKKLNLRADNGQDVQI